MSKDDSGKDEKSELETKGYNEGKENRKPTTNTKAGGVRETVLLDDDSDTAKSRSMRTLPRDDSLGDDTGSSFRERSTTTSCREKFKTRSERLKEARSTSDLSDDFRSESLFGSHREKEKRASVVNDDEDYGYRRPSFMSSLHNTSLAQLNEPRPKSTCDYLQERLNRLEGRNNKDAEKVEREKSPEPQRTTFRRGLIYTNAELTKMAETGKESEEAKKSEEKNSPEKSSQEKSSQEKTSQEYNPSKRIPLKQRLKNKMSSTSTDLSSTDTDADTTGGHHTAHTAPFNTPQIGRHQVVQSDPQDATNKNCSKKDDSLKSRLLRKFHIGSEEKKEERKETTKERKSRKKNDSESSHDETNRKEKSREIRNDRKSSTSQLDEVKASAYDQYSNRALMMSMDHRLASIDISMENIYKTGTSLAEILVKEEEKTGIDMSRYHGYSPDVKRKFIDRFDTSESNNEQDASSMSPKRTTKKGGEKDVKRSSDENISPMRSPRKLRRNRKDSHKDSDDDVTITRSPLKNRRKLRNDGGGGESKDSLTSRRFNHNNNNNDSSDSDNSETVKRRRAPLVYEDRIRPLVKKTDSFQMDFRSPRASVHEYVVEDIQSVEVLDEPLRDDIFNVLMQREVSVESLHILCKDDEISENRRLSKLFERMSRLSFDSYHVSNDLSDQNSSNVGELARTIRNSIASLNDQTFFENETCGDDKTTEDVRETVLCDEITQFVSKESHSNSSPKRRPDSGSYISVDVRTDTGEVVVKTCTKDSEETTTKHNETKFDSSPFQLRKSESVFEDAVEETKQDVNKMIQKCDSIDTINNEITSRDSSPTKSPEPAKKTPSTTKSPEPPAKVPETKPTAAKCVGKIDTSGVQLRVKKKKEGGSDFQSLAEKRHSLVERRLALLQREQAVETRRAQRPKSMGSISNSKNLFENGYTVATTIKLDEDMTKKCSIGPSSVTRSMSTCQVNGSRNGTDSNSVSLERSTSNVVNADSSDSSAKSLSDIKSRISAIKARREALSKLTGKTDNVMITEVANI